MKKIKPSKKSVPAPQVPQTGLQGQQERKLGAQEFFDVVMKAVDERISSALLPIKRDIFDHKFQIKSLRNGVLSVELDFKSLGIALGQLGIVEIQILNQTKNSVRNKISVVSLDGKIYGGLDINRYNLVAKEGLLVSAS